MDLSCELSPLVYQALYQIIFRQADLRSAAVACLAENGGDEDMLQILIRGYQSLWRFQVEQAAGDATQLWPMDERHAKLATWILAWLRSRLKRPSEDFSARIRQIIAKEAEENFGESTMPDSFQPVVLAWTLGQVRGRLDASLPAIPAIPVPDPDVALAYSGLVIHLLNLQGSQQPWPEIIGSSTLWRSAGIIDGLKTQPNNKLWPGIQEAMLQAEDVIPPLIAARLWLHWREFRMVRNGLTHIWKEPSKYSFSKVATHVGQWPDIELSIRGITLFVFSEISLNVLEDSYFGADQLLDEVFREVSSYVGT